jgi:hypothetical protein
VYAYAYVQVKESPESLSDYEIKEDTTVALLKNITTLPEGQALLLLFEEVCACMTLCMYVCIHIYVKMPYAGN